MTREDLPVVYQKTKGRRNNDALSEKMRKEITSFLSPFKNKDVENNKKVTKNAFMQATAIQRFHVLQDYKDFFCSFTILI